MYEEVFSVGCFDYLIISGWGGCGWKGWVETVNKSLQIDLNLVFFGGLSVNRVIERI